MILRPRISRNGFTLIELLVVIAIISLLVSILLPSLQKAKQLAKQVVCLTKLKSIGAANFLHINDYDGRGSIGVTNGSSDSRPGWTNWPGGVNPYGPYGGDLSAWGFGWFDAPDDPKYRDTLCEYLGIKNGSGPGPRESRQAAFCPNFEFLPIEHESWRTSYAVNAWMGYDTYLGDHVENMASTPMIMDGLMWEWEVSLMAFPNGLWYWFSGDEIFLNQASFSHEGTGNYLFFDGHAENHVDAGDVDTFRYDLGWTWYGNNQQR